MFEGCTVASWDFRVWGARAFRVLELRALRVEDFD